MLHLFMQGCNSEKPLISNIRVVPLRVEELWDLGNSNPQKTWIYKAPLQMLMIMIQMVQVIMVMLQMV
jgi:hypothetical protein